MVISDEFERETAEESDAGDSLSEYQMELLRAALVDHGKRLAELEERIIRSMADMEAVNAIVRKTHDRMRRIGLRLGVVEAAGDIKQDGDPGDE